MMNHNYKVSVGMPVWGVENYINRCIESILNQDFDDYEVIVVDDCSPDNSINIVKDIKASHPKGDCIRIIRQPQNMGCWAARNTILEQASGKYILLIDSDDYLAEGAIRKLFQKAEETSAEATYGSTVVVDEKGAIIDNSGIDGISLPSITLMGVDKLAYYANSSIHRRKLNNFIWNILIRKDFLEKHQLKFRKTKFWDDVLFNADMQPLIQSATFISDITYMYVIHANSLSNFQSRKQINTEEIRQHNRNFQYLKKQCLLLKGKCYYESRITKIMLDQFYILTGAIKNKDFLTSPLKKVEFREAIHPPISFREIILFNHHKAINLLFWGMGILPPPISYYLIVTIGKIKHLI